MIQLTKDECAAVYETLDMLSGGNPEYVFNYYGAGEPDDPKDPTARAFAKIFAALGRTIPPNLKAVIE